jgi:hypothetical protein
MWRVAERLWFLGRQAVKFCPKAGIGREYRHRKLCYFRKFHKNCPDNENP